MPTVVVCRTLLVAAICLSSLLVGCASVNLEPGATRTALVDAASFRTTAFTTPADPRRGRVYAILVGVSHYYGAARDLVDANDAMVSLAVRLQHALPDEARTVVLTDDDATRERLVRTVRAVSIRMRPADTLLLAFYVHGNRDALLLSDGELLRPQLGRLVDAVPGHVILAINACESGSFASLVAGKPGRWGMFSSNENELTYGAPMLRVLAAAFEHRVGRASDGSIREGAIADYVARSATMDHDERPHWTVAGFVARQWPTTLDPDARDDVLGGRLDARDAAGVDCRDVDSCVQLDDALDHVLDPLDDSGDASGGDSETDDAP